MLTMPWGTQVQRIRVCGGSIQSIQLLGVSVRGLQVGKAVSGAEGPGGMSLLYFSTASLQQGSKRE
jgi:hypothetical protein